MVPFSENFLLNPLEKRIEFFMDQGKTLPLASHKMSRQEQSIKFPLSMTSLCSILLQNERPSV